ncbi:MAG: hypothetical protein FJY95_06430 [Candidatus Handelsmanbacteria bacterium]|nr:hypothetical protein [Candidatus Handelsmanbacteria bacterium]
MNEVPELHQCEIDGFLAEGLLVLDRPLTWEMAGELLAALASGEPHAGN